MGDKIAFENGRISNFRGLVTLTLDRVILHTVMHHSSTFTYIPNVIEIEETFCGQKDGHLRPALLGRLRGVDLKIEKSHPAERSFGGEFPAICNQRLIMTA